MRCPDCHKTVDQSKQFCPYCGAAMPKAEQDKQANLKKKRIHIAASAIAVGLTYLCFHGLYSISQIFCYRLMGDLSKMALAVAWDVSYTKIIILVILGFSINTTLSLTKKNETRILYYIAWGVLCIGGIFVCAYRNPMVLLGDRNVPEDIMSFALKAVRAWGICYGLGVSLLNAAFFLSLVKPMSFIKATGTDLIFFVVSFIKAAVIIIIFFAGALAGEYYGIVRFGLGETSVALSAIGSILAFVASVALNRRKEL